MELLTAVLATLVVVAFLFEVARRIGVPYPTLLVLGGLGLAFVPGLPRLRLEPDLVLLVFLPPLLFQAATETPIRDLRATIVPLLRLSVGLVLFSIVVVAVVAHAVIPALGWPGAFVLGAIVAPTDALAATAVFRRLGAPRVVVTLIEGEALFNDATALVAYKTALLAVSGTPSSCPPRRPASSSPRSVASRSAWSSRSWPARSSAASTARRSRSRSPS